jgi:hypothetical protein
MVAQHKTCTIFPAGHTFSMTSEIDDDDPTLSVGKCTCAAVFKFPRSQHAKMDAAIEANWQKSDDLADKVDYSGSSTAASAPQLEAALEPAGPSKVSAGSPHSPEDDGWPCDLPSNWHGGMRMNRDCHSLVGRQSRHLAVVTFAEVRDRDFIGQLRTRQGIQET